MPNGLIINCKIKEDERWLGFAFDTTFHSVIVNNRNKIIRENYGTLSERKPDPCFLDGNGIGFQPERDVETGEIALFSRHIGNGMFEFLVGDRILVVRYD